VATTKLSAPASAAAAGVSAQENEKLPRVNIAPPARAGYRSRNTKDLTLRLGDELQNEPPKDQRLDLQTWWIFLRQNAKRIDIEVKFGKIFLRAHNFLFLFRETRFSKVAIMRHDTFLTISQMGHSQRILRNALSLPMIYAAIDYRHLACTPGNP
jgi:hypothetical protein